MPAFDRLAWQRNYRRANGNAGTRRYEKTKPGFLMRAYRNMQSRVSGVQWRKQHLYQGMGLLPRAEFYAWALASPMLHRLWDDWVAAGHSRTLTPSVDRLDSRRGYEVGNMEWVTHSENSRRGAVSRFSKQRRRHT